MFLFTEEVATEEFSLVELLQTVAGWLMQNGIKLIIGLIVLFITFKVVNFIAKRLQRRLDNKNVDKTIEKRGMELNCYFQNIRTQTFVI